MEGVTRFCFGLCVDIMVYLPFCSEVIALQADSLTMSERKGQVVVRQGKGLKERTVPLSRLARAALEEYLEKRPFTTTPLLFISQAGSPLASRDTQRLIENASGKAGIISPITPHILRPPLVSCGKPKWI